MLSLYKNSKLFGVLFFASSIVFSLKCQDFFYQGLNNYGGVMPVFQNPANMADNRCKWDLVILGQHIDFGNNYLGLKPEALKGYGWFKFNNPNFSDTAFKTKYLSRIQNGYQKEAFLNLRFLLPSFMINLSEKHSVAFTWSIRSLFNVYNVNQQLADLLYSDIRDNNLFLTDFNYRLSLVWNTFAEYSGTYARVLFKKKMHFLKAGLSLKLLQGMGSIYAYADPLNYPFTSDSTLDIYNTQIGYGHSNNFELVPDWIKKYSFNSKTGLGTDIGFVYEFRPRYSYYQYRSTDGKSFERRDLNKYLFKLSASLSDWGFINYKKSPNSRDFMANTASWKFRKIEPGQNPIAAIDDTIKNKFTPSGSASHYKVYLPASLLLQSDVKILKNLYFNVSSLFNLKEKIYLSNSRYNVHHFSIRYERPHLSGAISLNYNDFMNTVQQPWSVGAMFHLWFLSFGTTNLNNLLYKRDIYGLNFFFTIKISPAVFRKPEDKDRDNVPDIGDLCPTIAGSIKSMGCPDTDKDGVPDIHDKCPEIAGEEIYQGCPDSDKDSIPDPEDDCPQLAGNKITKGCPDKDNDGVADKNDDCPDKAGLIQCKGCPYLNFEGIVLNTFNPADIIKDNIKVYLLDTMLNKLDSTSLNNMGSFSFPCVQGKYEMVMVMLDNNDPRVTKKARFYLMDPESKEIRRVTKRYGKYNYVFGELPLSKFEWYDLKGDGKLTLGGILLNADNNQPIANKKIFIKNDAGDVIDSTKTNSLGSFVFKFLEVNQNYLVYLDENNPELTSDLKIVLTNKEGKTLKTIAYNPLSKRFEFKILSADVTLLKELEMKDVDLNFSMKGIVADVKKNPLGNIKIYVIKSSAKDTILQTIITGNNGLFYLNNMKFTEGAYFMFEEDNPAFKDVLVILILDANGRVIKVLKRNSEGKFKFHIPDVIKTSITEFHIEDPWLQAINLKNKQMTVIENIIYPTNEYKVTKEGERILTKVAQVLKENSKLYVEIGSHTDSRANDSYNLKLSQKRAQYVVDYLVKLGIDKTRLKAVGYGETQILNHCRNKVKCTDAEHSINRRTEFKIKEMD